MDFSYLINIAIIGFAAYFAIKVISKILKFALWIVVLIGLLAMLGNFSVKSDFADIKGSADKPRMFLLSQDGELKAAFTTTFGQKEVTEERGLIKSLLLWNPSDFAPEKITPVDTAILASDFANKNYQLMLKDNYRLYVIDSSAITMPPLAGEIAIDAQSFAIALSSKITTDDYFLVSGYNKENIDVYPKTAVYKMVDKFPGFIWKAMIG